MTWRSLTTTARVFSQFGGSCVIPGDPYETGQFWWELMLPTLIPAPQPPLDKRLNHQFFHIIFPEVPFTSGRHSKATKPRYEQHACVPPKFIHRNPDSQWDGIRRWTLWELTRFRWSHEAGVPHVGINVLTGREWDPSLFSRPCEDTARRWLSADQEEGPHQNSALLVFWSGPHRFQHYKE